MKTISIESTQLTRKDVETALIFPKRGITSDSVGRETAQKLYALLTEQPGHLEELGISKVVVYNPLCTDPVQGLWTLNRHFLWIDKQTGIPLDSTTVKIEDRLPADVRQMKRSELIELLPPTYFRNQADAKLLAELFEASGPIGDSL